MEFFDWFSIPQLVFAYYEGGLTFRDVYICLGVAGGLYLLGLIFGGIGLYTMARRAGVKHGWIAFLPFGNTYFAGKMAGEANFFGQKMKRAGLYAMLAEIAYVGINVLGLVISITLSNPLYWDVTTGANGAQTHTFNAGSVPLNLQWMIAGSDWCDALSYLAYILLVVFLFVVFIALFRKYYARGPMLMAILSAIFPFRGFVLFAVRKNTPVDYEALMRARMEEMLRRQQPQSPYADYGGKTGGGDDAPFSDFGGEARETSGEKQENPFSEFDDE